MYCSSRTTRVPINAPVIGSIFFSKYDGEGSQKACKSQYRWPTRLDEPPQPAFIVNNPQTWKAQLVQVGNAGTTRKPTNARNIFEVFVAAHMFSSDWNTLQLELFLGVSERCITLRANIFACFLATFLPVFMYTVQSRF